MSANGSPRTRKETEQLIARIESHWTRRDFGLWAVEGKLSGRFIGRIGLQHHEDWLEGEHKVEVSWLLDKACWGCGLATEGARASLGYGFGRLGLERVISIAFSGNAASRRVMEKCGLTLQGGTRWKNLDVVWYAIDREEWETPAADRLRR